MAEGRKPAPDDFDDPEDFTADEREEIRRTIDELERNAGEALDEMEVKPLGSVRGPMEMPDVLRKPAATRPGPKSAEAGMWGMAKAWGTALDFIFTIVAGGALGWGFDKWRGTAPNGMMVGIGVGFVVAFIRIVRSTLRQEREEARERESRRRP